MTDLAAVNYKPLVNMKGVWLRTLKNLFYGYGYLVTFIIVTVSLLLASTIYSNFVAIPIFYAVYVGWRATKAQDQVWRDFAAANGWPVDIGVSDQELISPSLNYGHSQKLSPVIQANINNQTVYLFSYKCTTGSGKSSQEHYFTVAALALPAALPHVLLLSKKNHGEVRVNLADHEKLKLEGDFNNYFTLQVEKGQEINVLAILAPDVMQTLIQANQTEDIEIFNTHIYFILNNDKRGYEPVENLINSVVSLSNQIIENIKMRGLASAHTLDAATKNT